MKYVLVPGGPLKVRGLFGKKMMSLCLSINFIRFKDSCIEERIYYQTNYTKSCMVCDITLKISKDYEWKIIVNGHTVDVPVIADIPEVLNQDNISMLYRFLLKIVVCKGNADFQDILERCIEIKE